VLTGKAASLQGQPLPDGFPPLTRTHQDLSAFADWLVARAVAQRPT
jgi:D-glycero-D-manno-heptose 1,7-bisphosphate phosphatase